MAQLTISLNKQVIKRLRLTKPSYIIGRAPSCDIQLPDRTVSSQHARIVVAGEDCFLEDLGSTNKILINSQAHERHLLKHQDIVMIGAYHLEFMNDPSAQAHQPEELTETPQAAQLEILTGRKQGQLLPLTKDRINLGNNEYGSVTLQRNTSGNYILQTLNDKNEKVLVKLQNGHVFKVGQLALRFHEVRKAATLEV